MCVTARDVMAMNGVRRNVQLNVINLRFITGRRSETTVTMKRDGHNVNRSLFIQIIIDTRAHSSIMLCASVM